MGNYNNELTKEELEQIEKATRDIGKYGNIELIVNGDTIDLLKTERIRLRNGKRPYHQG